MTCGCLRPRLCNGRRHPEVRRTVAEEGVTITRNLSIGKYRSYRSHKSYPSY